MIAIAWAIICAGIYIAPPRDKKDDGFYFNNWIDFLLFSFSFLMVMYFSFSGK